MVRRQFPPSLKLVAIAAVVGAAAGSGAILFWILVTTVQRLLFGSEPQGLYSAASALAWWQLLLWPTIGGAVIGQLIHYTLQHRRPHSVADVIESSALHGGHLTMRNGIAAALVNAASIGCGASVGREGPIVHVGATLGSWVCRTTGISQGYVRRLVGCGVAAAIAASFNAPIAGAIFAIEVVVGKYTLHTFAPIAISTIVGTSISHLYFGADPAFNIPEHPATSPQEFPLYALLGIVCALVTIALIASVALTQAAYDRLRVSQRLRPAFGGFLVGLIALYTPQVLGVGYETTDAALREAMPAGLLLLLVVTKLVASGVSLGSGFGGGVFSPSLFIGAMTGGGFGAVSQLVSGNGDMGYSAFTVVGMAAVAAATLGAPLSTTLIVFEMTGDYPLTLAVMLAVIISSIIVNDFWGYSFFTWQLKSRGIDLTRSPVEQLMQQVRMKDLMDDEYVSLEVTATTDEIREALRSSVPVYVVDEDGAYVGTLAAESLPGAASADLSVAELCRRDDTLRVDDDMVAALASNDVVTHGLIPVLQDDDSKRLRGHVSAAVLMHAYRGILERVGREERSFSG